ncbi:MAG: DUF1801 domain-containing protein [Chitinophagales bacterium]
MTVDQYFKSVPEERITDMAAVRQLIRSVFPNAEETMLYKMPTYLLDGEMIVSLASQKKYMALYVCEVDLKNEFGQILKDYNCGKSCIRFPKLKPDSLPTFEKVLLYIRDHN